MPDREGRYDRTCCTGGLISRSYGRPLSVHGRGIGSKTGSRGCMGQVRGAVRISSVKVVGRIEGQIRGVCSKDRSDSPVGGQTERPVSQVKEG